MNLMPSSAQALLNFWEQLRGESALPMREQLTPQSLQVWLGQLSINELHYTNSKRQVFVGIQGEFVSRGMQDSFSGKYLLDCVPDFAVEHAVRPYLLAADLLQPTCSVIAPTKAEIHERRFLRLILPLAEYDQNTTAYFVVFTEIKGLAKRASGSIYSLWADDESNLFHQFGPVDEVCTGRRVA